MTQKEEIKQERQELTGIIRVFLSSYGGIISSVELKEIDIPKPKILNESMIDFIFNDQKEKFYNKEFSALQTTLRNSAKKAGRKAFEYQYNFVQNSSSKLLDNRFTRDQICVAYKKVLEELYSDVV